MKREVKIGDERPYENNQHKLILSKENKFMPRVIIDKKNFFSYNRIIE